MLDNQRAKGQQTYYCLHIAVVDNYDGSIIDKLLPDLYFADKQTAQTTGSTIAGIIMANNGHEDHNGHNVITVCPRVDPVDLDNLATVIRALDIANNWRIPDHVLSTVHKRQRAQQRATLTNKRPTVPVDPCPVCGLFDCNCLGDHDDDNDQPLPGTVGAVLKHKQQRAQRSRDHDRTLVDLGIIDDDNNDDGHEGTRIPAGCGLVSCGCQVDDDDNDDDDGQPGSGCPSCNGSGRYCNTCGCPNCGDLGYKYTEDPAGCPQCNGITTGSGRYCNTCGCPNCGQR